MDLNRSTRTNNDIITSFLRQVCTFFLLNHVILRLTASVGGARERFREWWKGGAEYTGNVSFERDWDGGIRVLILVFCALFDQIMI